ncbi:Transposase [Paraburkholderia steynii]|uniref:Transposase n=1 Tax=Paraburkholderia steynii TaxID=1245441 RepID=A0A7Z7FPZ5_9BURK|nr:Transposase [Paraburkholderia steynii]
MKPDTTRVSLSMRELDRLKVIEAIVEIGLKPGRAAERLGLSVRQVERLVSRYREHGPSGVASGRRGRPGNRKLDAGLALRALTIIRERYADFGPTLAREKLDECHGIRLAKETVSLSRRDRAILAIIERMRQRSYRQSQRPLPERSLPLAVRFASEMRVKWHDSGINGARRCSGTGYR